LKARRLLGDVDVDRCPREHGSYRERKLPSQHFAFSLDPNRVRQLFRRDRSECVEKQRAVHLAIARTGLSWEEAYMLLESEGTEQRSQSTRLPIWLQRE
jgi:hypothetical protein